MDVAVKKYRIRRDERLKARAFNVDDEVEENNNGGGSKNHGNTRLPYGLCKKYGIEYGEDWTPKDAWNALADKGVTPEGEYSRLSGNKTTLRSAHGTVFRNLRAEKTDRGLYRLSGDYERKPSAWTDYKKKTESSQIATFLNRDEMISYLKSKGINRFKDPDSGRIIDPQRMDAPKIVATYREGMADERRYKDMILGVAPKGPPYFGRGYTVTGIDFTKHRDRLKVFDTPEKARKFAEGIGCKPEDLRESKDFIKYTREKKE